MIEKITKQLNYNRCLVMMFSDGHFQTTSIADLTRFARFLERYDTISLKNEIKSRNGQILVMAERPLTENFIKSLLTRNDIQEDTFIFVNTENFKASIINKIIKEFEKRLDMSDYSFASFLLKQQEFDIRRVVRGSFSNSFFFGFLTTIIMEKKAITDHLIEVALTSIGLLLNSKIEQLKYSDLIKLFQAAILHDFTITDKISWEKEDTFETKVEHDRESAMAVSDKELSPDIPEIILSNNKLQPFYREATDVKWYKNLTEIMSVTLNLVEYYTYLKRNSDNTKPASGEKRDEMSMVLYQLSLITEKGYFPSILLSHFEKFFNKYEHFFQYGKAIGKVEAMCIFEKYAYAYPKPKSTQLLCKNSSFPCEHRFYSQPLKVVQDHSSVRFIEKLYLGWYDKCLFNKFLPEPPENI